RTSRVEGRPQHRSQTSPRPRRTRSGTHEVLEHPAQLPTQTRRRLLRRQGRGPHAQPRHDPLNTGQPTKDRAFPCPPPQLDHYGTTFRSGHRSASHYPSRCNATHSTSPEKSELLLCLGNHCHREALVIDGYRVSMEKLTRLVNDL